MFGTLTATDDDRWELRFTRHLDHTPQKVWRAITESEHLEGWFPTTIEGDRAAGAPLSFRFPVPGVDPMAGEMLAFDPPHIMALTWGGDVLRLELQPEGDGTLLMLTDTFDELGKAARDGAGWHECLDLLPFAVTGTPPPFALGSVWREVHPTYQERFGPEASTLGPPDGFEVPAT